MSKKITDENGNTYVQKKPFYKRIWFWILVVIVVAIGGSALGGNKNNGGKQVSSNSSNKEASSKMYKLGDTVKVGDATYTLKSVEKTDERNEMADKQPANVIKVVYHVKNDGKEDLPVGTDLNVYGPDNNKLDTYALENTMDSVAAGKEMDVTAAYGTDKLGKFELQFAPLISIKQAAKYSVEVN
ncbi:DUF4352 domain-containing protein [Latilactobacillus fragifolii]|uniref:DUF4352 domain-containing protein n=1 Tax=Latilactobacillus fragifolii TaxID=2814244 RepID=UPI001ABB61F7|nr:DUF4352 domain-containing protein [Latilactobacillus fragifolii]